MKIKFIKVYQSVEFGKGRVNELSFLAAEYHPTTTVSRAPKVNFEQREDGVIIYNDDDAIFVSKANIAYMKLDRESFTPKAEVAKLKSGKSA